MKDLIKILIALSFMVTAFFVGQYFSKDKCNEKIKELDRKISSENEINRRLHDSITILSKKRVVLSKDTTTVDRFQSKKAAQIMSK